MDITIPTILACLVTIVALTVARHRRRSYLSPWNYGNLFFDERERLFYDPVTRKNVPFPTSMIQNIDSKNVPQTRKSQDRVDLSVIVPAFNEELRLPHMMDEALDYLENRVKQSTHLKSKFIYEVIVVDDGSTDQTTEKALSYSEKYGTDKVRVLTLVKNRGKGGAVRMGVLASRGQRILFADADGASKFSEIDKLDRYIDTQLKLNSSLNQLIAIGSRSHLEKDAIATRSLFRTVLMKGFHYLVWSTCVRSVSDSQCGFKMFTRSAAYVLFNAYHNQSWAFDVELLYIAERLGFTIGEIPITWHEIEGSKIVPVFSWLKMGRDVVMIALSYFLGLYQIPQPLKKTID
ncbi:Dolichyl-phosphate beta-glucosyltransferase, partial [Fragariocoptes setiger]